MGWRKCLLSSSRNLTTVETTGDSFPSYLSFYAANFLPLGARQKRGSRIQNKNPKWS
ncbi:Uncharacterised protein [Vibrio cholerae]|uniref:Uncharacterized protein n=1 Tax=Vibrio cholerae TaxID=666 RepID=A0A655Q3L3_VIBCL|nr:Uncharacterised protein [Vibrio cholerae]